MTIITLTTDFGLADGYVGMMKGVILGIAPDVLLIDLSHEIAAQDIRQAAYVLSRAAPYFPAGVIHLAVVDPGVGSARRPLLVTTPHACFVGPDNGLLGFALEQPDATAWVLNRRAFWLPEVSHTFHGRDIFAPVAAHLANGVAPAALGEPVADPVRLPAVQLEQCGSDCIRGAVIHVDRFGNLISAIPGAWLEGGDWRCNIAGRQIRTVSQSYTDVEPGGLLAIISSGGTLEIAVRDGNAAQSLGVRVGEMIELQRA